MLIQIHLPCSNFHCPLQDEGIANIYNAEFKLKIRMKPLAVTELYECQSSASCETHIPQFHFSI